jgi:hypothetical protein
MHSSKYLHVTNLVLRVCESLRIPSRNIQCYCSVHKAVFRLFNGDSKLNESKLGKNKNKNRGLLSREAGEALPVMMVGRQRQHLILTERVPF